MYYRLGLLACIVFTVAPIALCWAFVAFVFPDTIPLHFGANGSADRFGPKEEEFLFGGILAFCNLIMTFCYAGADKLERHGMLNSVGTHRVRNARISLVAGSGLVCLVALGVLMFTAHAA